MSLSVVGEKIENHSPVKAESLQWLNMSAWDTAAIPERKWAIRDRVPLNQAGLFSGEGGTGKSIIELMKNVAHVAAKDWLGSMPEPGPAFYLGAEDDEEEIHIRLAAIAKHYGVTFKQLTGGGLHVLPLLGQDATLCAVAKGGRVEVTALYRQTLRGCGRHQAEEHLDRHAVTRLRRQRDRSGAGLCLRDAHAGPGHGRWWGRHGSEPSQLAGINSGSGISGSTAWHGAFRFRQYLKGVKAGDGEQPENDLRELEFKKNQYGPRGENIVLRYQRGLFLPEGGVSSLDKASRSAKAEEVFMDLLRRFSAEGRNVSENKNAPTYAPAKFEREEEAKTLRFKKAEFEHAMRDLFRTQKLRVEPYGKASLGRQDVLRLEPMPIPLMGCRYQVPTPIRVGRE